MNVQVIDSYQLYLNEIEKYPLLTREEEYRLAVEYHKTKAIEIAHKLVVSSLRYVVKIANQYRNYNFPIMDLIQEGNYGLMTAVKKFNPEHVGRDGKKTHLLRYAIHWIRQSIVSYIIDNWSLLKISTKTEYKQLFFNIDKHEELGLHKQSDIDEMRIRLKREESLSETVFDTEESKQDYLVCERLNQEDSYIELETEHNNKLLVNKALNTLNDRDRYLVENRLMEEKKTLRELAKEFSVSPERVRQLEEKCVKNLRKFISSENNVVLV